MFPVRFFVWASVHRNDLIWMFGLAFWVAAYWWFLKDDFDRWRRERRSHKWSIDMVTKKGKGGRPDSV
jgi:hypothetical protein